MSAKWDFGGDFADREDRFDQQTLKARTVFSLTIDDTIVAEEDRPWMPLQTILEQYLDMIELEKSSPRVQELIPMRIWSMRSMRTWWMKKR